MHLFLLKNKKLSGIIDYNFLCFKEGITRVFELREKAQQLEYVPERDPDEEEDDDDYNLDEHINGESIQNSHIDHSHNDGAILA